MSDPHMNDDELDRLLKAATHPRPSADVQSRLLGRLQEKPFTSTVVPFASQRKGAAEVRSRLGWLTGLPLAASLAAGIYLGSTGSGANFLPDQAFELLAGVGLDESLSGIDEALETAEEDNS